MCLGSQTTETPSWHVATQTSQLLTYNRKQQKPIIIIIIIITIIIITTTTTS